MDLQENYNSYLVQAKNLVSYIEAGDVEKAGQCIESLTKVRESMLFQELGKLTRELHNTLNNLHIDTRLSDLAESEIPDAKERLAYVIQLTEEAANKTLGVVEETLPRAEELEQRALELKSQWDRFRSRDMKVDEFRGLTQEIDEFLTLASKNATHVRSGLSDVMMAQGFQDITGQIIRRVINMVQELEASLVCIIKLTGNMSMGVKPGAVQDKDTAQAKTVQAEGPQVPNLNKDKGQVVCNQDEVDDLLSSLGF